MRCNNNLPPFCFNAIALKASDTTNENTIYDSDTNHLWNRLNETLFERTAQDGKKYGLDELDILYWDRTTNLLTGGSHQQALSILTNLSTLMVKNWFAIRLNVLYYNGTCGNDLIGQPSLVFFADNFLESAANFSRGCATVIRRIAFSRE